jgi:hypothetical protein
LLGLSLGGDRERRACRHTQEEHGERAHNGVDLDASLPSRAWRLGMVHPVHDHSDDKSGSSTACPASAWVESPQNAIRPSVTNEWQTAGGAPSFPASDPL